MPADEQPCCEVGQDPDAEQDVERLGDLSGWQERGRDDEEYGNDIERQQGIAETDTARRSALVKLANTVFQGSQGHGDIYIRLRVLLQ